MQSVQYLGSRTIPLQKNSHSALLRVRATVTVKDTEYHLNLFREGVAVCTDGTTVGK